MDRTSINPSHPKPIELEQVCSRVDTDSTADNLPGPGRTLDKAYGFAGHYIEALINNAAKRMGKRYGRLAAGRKPRRDESDSPMGHRENWNATEQGSFLDGAESRFVCSNTDTDETADGLPGPGRSLGVLYDFVGPRIEYVLNRAAEQMGHGPRVTAQRIRRRLRLIEHSFQHYDGRFCWECWETSKKYLPSPSLIKSEVKALEKDARQLLRYIKSDVLSARKQAIDHILDLTVEYDDLRSLFKTMGVISVIEDTMETYSNFRFGNGFYDKLLLSSSRKALVSLVDAEINSLLQEWLSVTRQLQVAEGSLLWRKLVPFLRNEELAFLVMRILKRTATLGWAGISRFRDQLAQEIISCITNAPIYFEWKECETLFEFIFTAVYVLLPSDAQLATTEFVLRFAGKMPRVLRTSPFEKLSAQVDKMHHFEFQDVYTLKANITQIISASVENDQCAVYMDALKVLHPFYGVLNCPLERILCKHIQNRPFLSFFGPELEETAFCAEVARCIDSPDCTLQQRAWEYVNYLLALDINRCDMMLQALSTTSFVTTIETTDFKKVQRMKHVPKADIEWETVHRHFESSTGRIHLGRQCSCDAVQEEQLKYAPKWTPKLSVERGRACSSKGHYPLLAGLGEHRKPNYIASIQFPLFACLECRISVKDVLVAVAEGTKPEDLHLDICCPHQKVLVFPERFDVLVLRYSPEECSESFGSSPEGLDPTGPFSWNLVEKRDMREQCTVNVAFIEKAMRDGGSLNNKSSSRKDEEDVQIGANQGSADNSNAEAGPSFTSRGIEQVASMGSGSSARNNESDMLSRILALCERIDDTDGTVDEKGTASDRGPIPFDDAMTSEKAARNEVQAPVGDVCMDTELDHDERLVREMATLFRRGIDASLARTAPVDG